MMHELKCHLRCPDFHVDRHQMSENGYCRGDGAKIEVGSSTGRCNPRVLVDRDLRPDASVRRSRPTSRSPTCRCRAGRGIVLNVHSGPGADVGTSLRVVVSLDREARGTTVPTITVSPRHGRRRVQADFAGFQIDRLTVAVDDAS